jgi:enoyl-CoA hydratase/carnithine racemase
MTLHLDQPEPQVLRLTLDRVERMNALDGPTLQALNDAVRESVANSVIKVIIIRGTGRAFCAGNDLKWLASGVLADRSAHMHHQDLLQDTFERLESSPKIVIASVNGIAVAGGFELALACDLIVVDEAAQLGDAHIERNLLPSGGSTQRLPRYLGLQRALYYLVTGRRMTGREAVDLGLAVLATSAEELEAKTLELAQDISRADGMALAAMKAMARKSMELPLQEGLRYERWMQHRYRTHSSTLENSVQAFASTGSGVSNKSNSHPSVQDEVLAQQALGQLWAG